MPCVSYGPPNSYSTFLVAIGVGLLVIFQFLNEWFTDYQKSSIDEGDLIFYFEVVGRAFYFLFENGAIRNESHPI